jgi:hypothetical protein
VGNPVFTALNVEVLLTALSLPADGVSVILFPLTFTVTVALPTSIVLLPKPANRDNTLLLSVSVSGVYQCFHTPYFLQRDAAPNPAFGKIAI